VIHSGKPAGQAFGLTLKYLMGGNDLPGTNVLAYFRHWRRKKVFKHWLQMSMSRTAATTTQQARRKQVKIDQKSIKIDQNFTKYLTKYDQTCPTFDQDFSKKITKLWLKIWPKLKKCYSKFDQILKKIDQRFSKNLRTI
jgi:hypothetical protein